MEGHDVVELGGKIVVGAARGTVVLPEVLLVVLLLPAPPDLVDLGEMGEEGWVCVK